MSEQDRKDGTALRRLREAAPGCMVESYGPSRDTKRFLVQVVPWVLMGTAPAGTIRRVSREGATMSEAADKAREALK